MKKNKYIFIMAAVCTLYCLNTQRASAQKVYKDGEMYILDCGPDSGFPQGATSMTTKIIANATPSNTGEPMAQNTESGTINAAVYQKLEIAASDLSNTYNWATAYTQCATDKGSGWRLPTQREFTLIAIFGDAFTAFNIGFQKAEYWTGTESATSNNTKIAWMLNLALTVYTHNFYEVANKTQSKRVRCVREVSSEEPTTTREPKKTNK
ncbi:DUF1566 domain-containing protein [Bacteroides sp.]|uniref:Lcl domain-containing protein n=1 Tax=Bacteroides sp. TaxID=29523 RepID=UPI003AB4D856